VKVIFIEDVPNVARVGQTRTVADGYARNYLLPRKLAVLANSQAAIAMEAQLQKKIKQRELEEAEMMELAKKIEGIEITLEAPIKQAGSTDVTVRLAHEISAVIKVNVVSDEAAAEPAVEAEKTGEKKEKARKKEKKAEKEEPAEGEKEAVVVEAEKTEEPAKAVKEKKPAKKKKAKAAKAKKEEKPAEDVKPAAEKPEEEAAPVEEKKIKKSKAKAKKAETGEAEEKKES